MPRAIGARAQMALAFETTYGTPPAGGFTRMPFASATLGAEQPLLSNELLGYGRDPLPSIDASAIDLWQKSVLGGANRDRIIAAHTP